MAGSDQSHSNGRGADMRSVHRLKARGRPQEAHLRVDTLQVRVWDLRFGFGRKVFDATRSCQALSEIVTMIVDLEKEWRI